MKQWELRGVMVDMSRNNVALNLPQPDDIDVPRVLVDQFPIVIWTTDEDLRFTSCRGNGLERLGLGADQMVGATLFEFFETDDPRLPAVAAHLRALTGESVAFELRLAGRIFHCRVAPLEDSSGEQIGTICVALDGRDDSRFRRSTRDAILAVAG